MAKTVDQMLDERRKLDAKIKSAKRTQLKAEKARQAQETAALGATVLEAFRDQIGGFRFDTQVGWAKRIVGHPEVHEVMRREVSDARQRVSAKQAAAGGSQAQ